MSSLSMRNLGSRREKCWQGTFRPARGLTITDRDTAKSKQLIDVVQLLISPGEAEVVASSKADQIKSITDLKGKNLGVTELGSGTQTITQYMLSKKGIPSDQVQFVPVGAGDTFIAAIKQGKIDAGMTTEPTISRLLQSGDGKVLIDLRTPDATRAALGADYPFICIFMQLDYVNSHKDITQRLVNAYVKTLKWINTHTAAEVADKMPADYYAGNKRPLCHRTHQPVRHVQP